MSRFHKVISLILIFSLLAHSVAYAGPTESFEPEEESFLPGEDTPAPGNDTVIGIYRFLQRLLDTDDPIFLLAWSMVPTIMALKALKAALQSAVAHRSEMLNKLKTLDLDIAEKTKLNSQITALDSKISELTKTYQKARDAFRAQVKSMQEQHTGNQALSKLVRIAQNPYISSEKFLAAVAKVLKTDSFKKIARTPEGKLVAQGYAASKKMHRTSVEQMATSYFERETLADHLILGRAADTGNLGRFVTIKNKTYFIDENGRQHLITPSASRLNALGQVQTCKRLVSDLFRQRDEVAATSNFSKYYSNPANLKKVYLHMGTTAAAGALTAYSAYHFLEKTNFANPGAWELRKQRNWDIYYKSKTDLLGQIKSKAGQEKIKKFKHQVREVIASHQGLLQTQISDSVSKVLESKNIPLQNFTAIDFASRIEDEDWLNASADIAISSAINGIGAGAAPLDVIANASEGKLSYLNGPEISLFLGQFYEKLFATMMSPISINGPLIDQGVRSTLVSETMKKMGIPLTVKPNP